MQALQQELERVSKQRPSLTPRPSRELTPLKDLINNDKAGAFYGLGLCKAHMYNSTLRFSCIAGTTLRPHLQDEPLASQCVQCECHAAADAVAAEVGRA